MAAKTFGLFIVVAALVAGSVVPASAEFFGCNEPRVKVSSYTGAYRAYAQAPARRYVSQPAHRRYASQTRASFWH